MSAVYWCNTCSLPLARSTCEICNASSRTKVAADLVPVFTEELILLRDDLRVPHLPKRASDCYLWKDGTTYYRCGRPVFSVSFGKNGKPTLQHVDADTLRTARCTQPNRGRIGARLWAASRSSFEGKVFEAGEFIRRCVERFAHRTVLVAFSGGKDSQVVSSMVRRALGTAEVLHAFSDTTLEAPDTYQHIEEFCRSEPKVPLVILTPSVDFFDMCRRIGPPSRIHRWCCTSHKTAPMGVFIDLVSEGRGTLTFDGIRSRESARRARYSRVTLDHKKLAQQVSASPILSWRDFDVWAYLLCHDRHVNQAYRRGFRRVGCLNCPFVGDWAEYLAPKQAYAGWHESPQSGRGGGARQALSACQAIRCFARLSLFHAPFSFHNM